MSAHMRSGRGTNARPLRRRPEESDPGGQVRVHRLLQAVVRNRMSEAELDEVRREVEGINRQIDDVVHTYDVRNEARELTIALAGTESAQRGYLLTGDETYLESYQLASSTIGTRLLALTDLTSDDAAQARLDGERLHAAQHTLGSLHLAFENDVELVLIRLVSLGQITAVGLDVAELPLARTVVHKRQQVSVAGIQKR